MLVMRTMAAEMRRSPEPIAPPQMGTLMNIDASPATMSDLARSQAVTLPTVSKSVDMLVRRGWVARWIDKQDRRQTIVRLTPKGRRILADIKRRAERHVAERLAPLQSRERAELIAVMRGVARALALPGEDPCVPLDVKGRSTRARKLDDTQSKGEDK
jgi:DNA-binding MarR family transcriptional regulator